MRKNSKTLAVISYVIAGAFLTVYFAAEIFFEYYLSTFGKLVFLCGCCAFMWPGGLFLAKELKSNRPMVINLRIYLVLYLMLFASLTLFDPLWGRNGGFVIWTPEHLDSYFENSLNLVPFRTIAEYLGKGDFRQFIVNIAGNIVCLMPLGILLPLNFKKQRKTGVFLLTCTAIVAAVEILQIATLSGICDVDDLILNVGGAFLLYLFTKNKEAMGLLEYIFFLKKGESV